MGTNISSGYILQNLYSHNNGSSSYYTGVKTERKVRVNEEVESSLAMNSDFKKALRGLRGCDYTSGLKTDILKYTNKLIDTYNDFVKNKGNGSKRYNQKLKEITEVLDEYSSELSKVGVTMQDGKLKLDGEKFDEASVYDMAAIFSPDSEFTDKIDRKLNVLNNLVKGELNHSVKEETYILNNVNSNNISIADRTNKLAIQTEKLLNTPLAADNSNEQEILDMLNEYIDHVNSLYDEITDKAEYSQKAIDGLNAIIDLNSGFAEELNKDPFPYEELFDKENPSSYASQILPLYQNLFGELVNASAKGITINSFVDYQV
ncbi:MAG: hypothetical protein NC086_01685 [Alistipes sp.]|nr:hypothetical protein [Alistipes sp.]